MSSKRLKTARIPAVRIIPLHEEKSIPYGSIVTTGTLPAPESNPPSVPAESSSDTTQNTK